MVIDDVNNCVGLLMAGENLQCGVQPYGGAVTITVDGCWSFLTIDLALLGQRWQSSLPALTVERRRRSDPGTSDKMVVGRRVRGRVPYLKIATIAYSPGFL